MHYVMNKVARFCYALLVTVLAFPFAGVTEADASSSAFGKTKA